MLAQLLFEEDEEVRANKLLEGLEIPEPLNNAFLHDLSVAREKHLARRVPVAHTAAIAVGGLHREALQVLVEDVEAATVTVQQPGAGVEAEDKNDTNHQAEGRRHEHVQCRSCTSHQKECSHHWTQVYGDHTQLVPDDAVLVRLDKGGHFEHTPQPSGVALVPQHQHPVGVFQKTTDALDALLLQGQVRLVYADLVEENRPP
mmetsp:Transcript_64683/g.200526  ORF Transcript_64683/g.200526 Transcript_64683/m.200526 type:complete len:202 (+) Transcript_64683:464-1069(+)